MKELSVKQSFRLLHKLLSYSVIGLLFLIMLGMTSCSTSNFATHPISETPSITRQALIYDDHVVIVTRTKITLDQYNKIVAVTTKNREELK
jgi:hypothetical protein